MAIGLTTSLKVKKEVQYTAYPVVSDATFVNAGDVEDFSVSRIINNIPVGKLGVATLYRKPKTGERYRLNMKLYPSDTSIPLLKKCINLDTDDATDNRDQILTFFLSQLRDDGSGSGTLVEKFLIAQGCLCNQFKFDVASETLQSIDLEFYVISIAVPGTSHGFSGTPVFASALNEDVYSNLTPSQLPFSINSVTKYYMSISITVNHETQEVQPGAEPQLLGMVQGMKKVSMTFSIIDDGLNTQTTDMIAGTERTIELKLSSSWKFTLLGCMITQNEDKVNQTSSAVLTQDYTCIPTNCTLVAV